MGRARDDRLDRLRAAATGGDTRAMRALARSLRWRDPWESMRWALTAVAATEPTPPKVVAAAAGLGQLRLVFGRREWGLAGKVSVGVLVPLLIAAITVNAVLGAHPVRMLLLQVVPLSLLFLNVLRVVFVPARRVWVYERGCVHGVRRRPLGLAWADATVLRTLTRRLRKGRYQPRSGRYTLRHPDAAEFTFTRWTFGSPAQTLLLADAVERAVTAVHLPGARATLDHGGQLRIADLVVTRDGITGERGVVGWSELEDLDTSAGVVRIKRAGEWRDWSAVPVDRIPNVFLLNALVPTP